MKIFKKVSAIVASALMVGMSMGVAAAATYPSPFIQGGAGDVGIVVGSSANPLDGMQAGALNLNLNSYATGTSGSSSSVGGSGGDFKLLSTSARNTYFNDSLNSAWTTLTYTELPTILASGNFNDLAGNQYGYTQTMKPGSAWTTFSTSAGDLTDPKLLLDIGAVVNQNNYIFNYTLSMNKALNVSDPVNVIGQPINIMGQNFVIGSGSTNNTLYLNGAGQDVVLTAVGTPTTVTIGGTPHTITLTAATATNTATIIVDTQSKTVTQGNTYSYAGGLNIYVKQVTYQGYAGGVQSVELLIGSSALKIQDGQTVKTGTAYNAIQGTIANVAATGYGVISGFTIQVAANSTQNDFVLPGGSFLDPVFGAVKVNFVDAVPDIGSAARNKVEFSMDSGSNPQYGYLTFTSAKAGSAGEKKLTIVYDNNTATTAILPVLAHGTVTTSVNARGLIHVLENESAAQTDWIVLNQGDAGSIVSFDSFDPGNLVSGTVTLTDQITGQQQQITVTNSTGAYINNAATISGGVGYKVVVEGNTTYGGANFTAGGGGPVTTAAAAAVHISWNSGATALYPRIKLANGGWVALLQEETVVNTATNSVILPNGKTTLDTTGVNLANTSLENWSIANGIQWVYNNVTNNSAGLRIYGINVTSGSMCNFNVTRGPAVLIMEPKKYTDSSQGDFICIPESTAASTAMTLGDAMFNGTYPGFITLGSDAYQKQTLDRYGTFVVEKTPSNTNGDVYSYVPTTQMYVDLAFSSPSTAITANVASGGGASIGNVVVLDSQVSSVQNHNLIVVGGACINSAAATLLGGTKCGADWTTATSVGANQFLIQSFANANAAGKVALLVAGYEAQDTVNAATYLMNHRDSNNAGLDVSVGKKYVGTDAQTAQLVTTGS